jgi:lipid II:glycine glycyltransferase (peptidoglycan interpeptide bridge formation enzyme)
MFIKSLEPIDFNQYQSFLESLKKDQFHVQFEHSVEWAKILQNNFKHQPRHLIAKTDRGKICGALILFECQGFFNQKNLISSPYSIYTNILAEPIIPIKPTPPIQPIKPIESINYIEIKTALVNKAIEYCKNQNLGYLQLREYLAADTLNKMNLKHQSNVFNMSLKLESDIHKTWKKLPKSSIRWGIKKAEKSKLTFSKGIAPMHLDQFFNLFLQTRKHRGVPAYPKKYFQDIINSFANKDSIHHKSNIKSNVKIYISYYQEQPIAAIFLIYFNQEMRYFAAGATYNKQLLSMQPYHLIMWQAIKDATNDGFKTFNLGGATSATNDGGLLTFKKRWSDTVDEIPYFYYLKGPQNIPSTEESKFIQFASKIWKFLPTPIIKYISPAIIKKFN